MFIYVYVYLQKGDTIHANSPQFESHISEISSDIHGQYTSDEPFGIFEAEYIEEV